MDGASGADCVSMGEHIVDKFSDQKGKNDFFDVINKNLEPAKHPHINDAGQRKLLLRPVEGFVTTLLRDVENRPQTIDGDICLVRTGQEFVLPSRGEMTPRERAQVASLQKQRLNHLPEEARKRLFDAMDKSNPSGT